MRIAQVVHSFYPIKGGIENHTFYLAKELVRRGHKVTVFTAGIQGLPAEEKVDGILVRRIWALGLFGFSSVKFSPALLSELTKEDFDIYHSHGYGSLHPVAAAMAAKQKKKPFIFTLHGYQKFRGGFESVAQFLYRNTAARLFLPAADRIISVTDATLRDISREIDMDKVVVIPNGVDTKHFRPQLRMAPKIKRKYHAAQLITYVGRLDKYKGIDVLIRAFKKMREKLPKSSLLIAGKDEGIGRDLRLLARKLGVSDSVYFEEIEMKDMPAIYSASDVVVLPSYYEALSLTMLEALSCKVPFISTPTGAAPAVLRGAYGTQAHNFITKIGDSDDLAEKIYTIIKNKEKFTKAIDNGRKYVIKEFSWPIVCSRVLQVYKEALQGRK